MRHPIQAIKKRAEFEKLTDLFETLRQLIQRVEAIRNRFPKPLTLKENLEKCVCKLGKWEKL